MTLSCCPICYRGSKAGQNGSGTASESLKPGNRELEEGEVDKRFFRLFQRYLSGGEGEESHSLFPLGELTHLGVFGCGECRKLMEGFCDLYHQLKTIELKLNWRIQTLKGVMKGAQKVTARVKCFQEFVGTVKFNVGRGLGGWGKGDELVKEVIKSRKALIDKSSLKMRNTCPKLSIQKWRAPKTGTSSTEISPPPQPTCRGTGATDKVGAEINVEGGVSSKSVTSISNFINPIIGGMDIMEVPGDLTAEKSSPACNKLMSNINIQVLEKDIRQDPANDVGAENTTYLRKRKASSSDLRLNRDSNGSLGTVSSKRKQVCFAIEDDDDLEDNYDDHEENDPVVPDDVDTTTSGTSSSDKAIAIAPVPLPPKSDLRLPAQKLECVENPGESIAEAAVDKDMEIGLPQNTLEFESASEGPSHVPAEEKLVASDSQKAENVTATHLEGRSALRSTRPSRHCRKTFSYEEGRPRHIQEGNGDGEGDAVLHSNNEGADVDNDLDWDDSDNDHRDMSWTSSSSEDEYEIGLDEDAHQNTLPEEDPLETPVELPHPTNWLFSTGPKPDIKREAKGPRRKSRKRRRRVFRRQLTGKRHSNTLRWKCPDCGTFFLDAEALLIHRNEKDSPCNGSYIPGATIQVEVFARPPEDDYYYAPVDESKFTIKFALVKLQQEVIVCDQTDCGGLAFYSTNELDAHRMLHGSFQCKFCSVQESYAPSLAIHENLKHAVEKRKGNKKGKGNCHRKNFYNCPRCKHQFSSRHRGSYIRHHLSCHLKLSYEEPICAICKRAGKLSKSRLKEHLRTHHDFTNVANPDDIKICEVKDCSAYFLTVAQLAEHNRLCHPSMNSRTNFRLKCPDCDDLFPSVNDFLFHRMESESCGPFYDPTKSVRVDVLVLAPNSEGTNVEGSSFTNGVATIDLPQELFQCESCDIVLYSSDDLEAHQKLHGEFKCKFCPVTKSYAPQLAKHELGHYHGGKKRDKRGNLSTLYCPRCDFKATTNAKRVYLQHHLENHLDLTFNNPKCPICKTVPLTEASFASNPLEHFRTFHDLSHGSNPEKLFRCRVENCGAYFLKKLQLLNHLEFRHKKEREKKWQCDQCDMRFTQAQHFRRHRLKHVAPEDAIPCPFQSCKTVFANREELGNHIMFTVRLANHKPLNEINPPEEIHCPKCETGFSGREPGLLREHMLAEHGAPTHVCETCGKVFKHKFQLDIHYLSHSGPESWDHLCSVCSKKCISKQKLEEHMRTHTKDKPFVCQVCGQAYAHRHNLRIHVNNKHGDQVQDIPRKKSKANFSSRKGIKVKTVKTESKRKGDRGGEAEDESSTDEVIHKSERPRSGRKR